MTTNDPPEQKSSGDDDDSSTDAVIEFDNGQVGFPEDGPVVSVVETFQEHGLGNEVSWRTMATEVDHDYCAIIQVLDELEDLLLVDETEHSGEQWFRMEDTAPMREFVGNLTVS